MSVLYQHRLVSHPHDMTALGDHTVLLPEGIAALIGAPDFG